MVILLPRNKAHLLFDLNPLSRTHTGASQLGNGSRGMPAHHLCAPQPSPK